MRANPRSAPGCRWAASPRRGSWPAAGFAWLTVDIEHSLVDWETATHMFASIADAGCTALARVPANRHDHIKRVLDNGAHGIVVPMVNSRAGGRGRRRRRACIRRSATAASAAASTPSTSAPAPTITSPTPTTKSLVVLQCEHIQAVENADAIFSVPGIDAIFVGPNDLAASMRSKDGKPPSGEATTQGHEAHPGHLQEAQRRPPASTAVGGRGQRHRIEEGWQFIAIASELKMMLNGAAAEVQKLGKAAAKPEMAKY